MFWRKLPVRIWLLGLVLVVGLGVAFYLVLVRMGKTTITQQALKREQTVARAEASNISSFFQVFGESIAVFAQLSSMKNRDARTLQDMNVFVDQWRDSNLIGGVVLTDRQGTVQLNANVLGSSDVGASLADRDYFVWAENQPGDREYFVGQPVISRLGATKGQMIVPVAAAVYQKGVFVGALVASVKLRPLTERYLTLMKVSDGTEVYLTDDQGELVYSNSAPDTVGSNIVQLLPELKNRFNTIEEGKLQTAGRLVVYIPILLEGQNWFVVMATPNQDVIDLTAPINVRVMIMLLLVSLSMLILGLVIARDNQIQKIL